MNKKTRLKIFLLTLATFVSIMYYSCKKETKDVIIPSIRVPGRVSVVLGSPPERKTSPGRVNTPTPNLGTRVYVPPEGKITIVPVQKDKEIQDVVEIKVQTWGLTSKFGYQYALPLRVGLDWKAFYFGRLGVEPIGFLAGKDSLDFAVGASYRLDKIRFIDNTELKFSYSPLTQRVYFGLRANL